MPFLQLAIDTTSTADGMRISHEFGSPATYLET